MEEENKQKIKTIFEKYSSLYDSEIESVTSKGRTKEDILNDIKLIYMKNSEHLLKASYRKDNKDYYRTKEDIMRDIVLKSVEFCKIGLSLTPIREHIYWVYQNGQIGIITPKGFVALLGKNNLSITLQVVYKDDEFNVDLANLTIVHNPNIKSDSKEIICSYCVVRKNEANSLGHIIAIEVLKPHEIAMVKSKSKSKSLDVWNNFPEEMAKKSVLKRCVKKIHIEDDNFYKALALDNDSEFDFENKNNASLNKINNGVVNLQDIKEFNNDKSEPLLPHNQQINNDKSENGDEPLLPFDNNY